jgi:hypothetical protein
MEYLNVRLTAAFSCVVGLLALHVFTPEHVWGTGGHTHHSVMGSGPALADVSRPRPSTAVRQYTAR